jgi:hypothetical protein
MEKKKEERKISNNKHVSLEWCYIIGIILREYAPTSEGYYHYVSSNEGNYVNMMRLLLRP